MTRTPEQVADELGQRGYTLDTSAQMPRSLDSYFRTTKPKDLR